MEIHLNMYQTLAVAVLVLLFGSFLRHRIGFLEKFCIPAPVIGGLLFAILTCLCYVTGIAEFSFDDTLREVCMVFFFTSVGFQANLKVLKSGGTAMAVFLGLVVALIICQNLLAVGLSHVLHLNPLIILRIPVHLVKTLPQTFLYDTSIVIYRLADPHGKIHFFIAVIAVFHRSLFLLIPLSYILKFSLRHSQIAVYPAR